MLPCGLNLDSIWFKIDPIPIDLRISYVNCGLNGRRSPASAPGFASHMPRRPAAGFRPTWRRVWPGRPHDTAGFPTGWTVMRKISSWWPQLCHVNSPKIPKKMLKSTSATPDFPRNDGWVSWVLLISQVVVEYPFLDPIVPILSLVYPHYINDFLFESPIS